MKGSLRERPVAQVAEGKISTGKISSSSTSLDELLARWLDQVDNRLSPTTAREYRRIVNRRLGPDLGRLRLSNITTQRIDAYYAALTRDHELSPGTVRHVHAILRGSLGQAVTWGWIPVNPAISASPPKMRTKEITPPSLAATRKLLATADEYDVELAALLRVLAATGVRRGFAGLTSIVARGRSRSSGRSLRFPVAQSSRTRVARGPPDLTRR